MAKPKFRVKDDEVKAFFAKSIGQAQTNIRAATLAAAKVIEDEANTKAPGPHVTTKLKYVSNRGSRALIGPDKKHWFYQFFETGTQPHEVSPRRKRALKFQGVSGAAFARSVSVSGMAARPFLRPAADSKIDEAGRVFDKVLRD
jgi:hypothetical protein